MSDIESIIFYLLTFSVSIIFAKLLSVSYEHEYFGTGKWLGSLIYRFPLYFLMVLPLILITTYRFNVGVDYSNYEELYGYYCRYNGSIENIFLINKEKGYGLINVISYHLFHSYEGVKFLSALCIVIPASMALILYDKRRFVSGWAVYLLTLFPSSFNGVRQHIAVSICLLAIVLFYKNKRIRAIILVLLSTQFHMLSLITFIPFFLMLLHKKRINLLKFSLSVIAIILAGVFIGVILKLASNISFIAFYLEKYNDTYGMMSIMHFVTHITLKLPLSIIVLLYYKKLMASNEKNYTLLLYTFFDYVFILSSYYVRWAIRMQYYSMVAAPIVLIELTKINESRINKSVIKSLLIISYIIRFVILFGYSKYDGIIPFNFI